MSRRLVLCCACLLGAALAASADDYRFSGPYTNENLSIFLIHGAKRPLNRAFLTLEEALAQNKVVVYETGNVNQLAIENLSTEDVYIQSGDIVKGGQQDRVFPDDYLLPSKSGKVPIGAFCVEQGRWTRRGAERADRFNASTNSLPTKSLKLAARKQQDQGAVWQQVAAARVELAEAVTVEAGEGGGAGTRAFLASASPTSMQLALENKKVNDAAGAYIRRLSGIIDKPDVVGYAFAINGKLNSADVYASHDLFQRMWPKLLKASAMEAVAERRKNKDKAAPDSAAVRASLAQAEHGRESSKEIANRLDVVTKETPEALEFETRDRDEGGAWIHKSYVVK
ncbi:MAG TPA: DUF6569 family protein [Bryobacteraceae bacterium]|nr:DUF6569 family protein [Bryobacteraceae bacterium]